MLKVAPKKNASSTLSEAVRRRLLMKMEEEEDKKRLAPSLLSLPTDCFSCILRPLPILSLLRSSCVCKLWNSIVNSPPFIQSHLCHSESVPLFITSAPLIEQWKPSSSSVSKKIPEHFIVENHLRQEEALNIFQHQQGIIQRPNYLNFLDITDEGNEMRCSIKSFNIGCTGRVLGSCNGLILLENKLKQGGLVIMNPVTRKLKTLPVGTIVPYYHESYAFAFSGIRKEYIVVHMFLDGSSVSCETLTVEKRRWRMVNSPPQVAFNILEGQVVTALGALHWFPIATTPTITFLSFNLEEEKFRTRRLPKNPSAYDKPFELHNLLCFVTSEEDHHRIDIWVMDSLLENEWRKHHSITSSLSGLIAPVIGSRFGSHVVFKVVNFVGEPFQDVEEAEHEEMQIEGNGAGGEPFQDVEEAEHEEMQIEGNGAGGESNVVYNSPLYVYDLNHQVMKMVKMMNGSPNFPRFFIPHVNSLLWC